MISPRRTVRSIYAHFPDCEPEIVDEADAIEEADVFLKAWVKLSRDFDEDYTFTVVFQSLDWEFLQTPAQHRTAPAANCLAAIHADSIGETECQAFRTGETIKWPSGARNTLRFWTVQERPFQYLGEVHLLLHFETRYRTSYKIVPLGEIQAAQWAHASVDEARPT
jgi:hypothetical protein